MERPNPAADAFDIADAECIDPERVGIRPMPLRRFVPGLLLCCALTAVATVLEALETRAVGHPYLEALVLAILLGVAIRGFWTPTAIWKPGIALSGKLLLELAVVLLGASVRPDTVATLGATTLIGIVGVVLLALAFSYGISRLLGLSKRMAILIACGNSICGNSAIAAVAPVIGADQDDIASSIAFTAILGVVMVLGLPLLVPLFAMSLTQYGVLAGLTVYAVPQVLAATLPIGALSNQVGTVIKLVRVLTLGPLVFGLSLLTKPLFGLDARPAGMSGHPSGRSPRLLFRFVPWFILGFTLMALLRALGAIPPPLLEPLAAAASLLTTISMAAIGLGTDPQVIARAGARVTMAVIFSLLALTFVSFGFICVLHLQ